MFKTRDGVRVKLTAEEEAKYNAKQEAYAAASADRKLGEIKSIRNQKLQETDFYALSDVTMSDAMSTYRQNLGNIPQDYTTEAEYDLLLARDEQGNLTHSVWSKP